jgi:hypothetical protein
MQKIRKNVIPKKHEGFSRVCSLIKQEELLKEAKYEISIKIQEKFNSIELKEQNVIT